MTIRWESTSSFLKLRVIARALVIALSRLQYEQYCLSFSCLIGVSMRNEENIGHIARGEHVAFSLLLMDEILITC